MSELIDRQAAITLPVMPKEHREYQTHNLDDAYEQGWFDLQECIKKLPSVQPEPLTLRVNSELTKEEYDKLMQDIKDAPIVLLPYEQPDRKTREWLHDLLQDAIDAGIITEAQAVRIMDKEPG